MFNQLMRILKAPELPARPDLRLSVAVLLVEAARQDDRFDARERAVIERLLTRKFDLAPGECASLLAAAESRAAEMVQLHGHTSAVFEQMTPDDRIGLVEMLWEVAYADGVLDPEEDLLIRRVAGLIAVTDRDRVLARQRVAARLKGPGPRT
ncbi:MAG TPA: TerB family tellurite resistance protein [Rhizomicrobium sp.]|nr:TerB family tellurite resistance protein [Rhizomicrobium sp.]